MTLAQLKVGRNAVVKRLQGDDHCLVRLMEMGLTPGTVVQVNRLAPLGDPLYLSLRGYDLSIRKSEARRIEIDAL
jgi:Fe2+ transport system protein FeoA